MDPEDLQAKLTPDVKAVVVVHMRGFASDIERLVSIADAHGVPLFEDAVPALGVDVGGRKLGTFGRAGAFSTQSDKTINTGEGGFLVTSDRDLFERAVVYSGAYERQIERHTDPSPPPSRISRCPSSASAWTRSAAPWPATSSSAWNGA